MNDTTETPLQKAERLLSEMDKVLASPNPLSAIERVERFREFTEGFRETIAYQQGFRSEFEELCARVSKMLVVLTTRSPNLSRAIREVEGLRDARREMIEYIQRAKAFTPSKELSP